MGRLFSKRGPIGQKPHRWAVQCGRRQGLGLLLLSGSLLLMMLRFHERDLRGEAGASTQKRRLTEQDSSSLFAYLGFSPTALDNGAWVLHLMGTFYMFLALAIVCDEFFVPALEQISEYLNLRSDVAGATFMAAGGSAPEFFTSLIDYNVVRGEGPREVGLGTIIGSAVFNVLFVIGLCAMVSPTTLSLSMWPLARDATFYIVDLTFLTLFFSNEKIEWHESLIMLILYICYGIFMKYSECAEEYFVNTLWPQLSHASQLTAVRRVNVIPATKGETDIVPSSDRSVSVPSSVRHAALDTDSASVRRHSAADLPTSTSSLDPATHPVDSCTSIGSASTLTLGCDDRPTGSTHVAPQQDDVGDTSAKNDVSSFPIPKRERQSEISGTQDPAWKERTELFCDRIIIRRVQSLPVDETNHGEHASAWAEADLTDDTKGDLSWRAKAALFGSRKSVSGGGILSLNNGSVGGARHVNGTEVNTQSALRARIMTQMYRTGQRRNTQVSIEVNVKALAMSAAYTSTAEQSLKVSGTGEAPEEMSAGSRAGLGQVLEEDAEEEEGGLEIRCPTSDEGYMAWIKFFITVPIILILSYTIPDVRRPERQGWFVLSFLLSMCWIGIFTIFMLAWATSAARTFGMGEHLLGLTLLAMGTSVPDLITSIIVSKQGHGDMAVSSSIGSNIFDVTVGLPIPWLIYHVRKCILEKDTQISIRSRNLVPQALLLISMVAIMVISMKIGDWKMSRRLGFFLLVAYVLFLIVGILLEQASPSE